MNSPPPSPPEADVGVIVVAAGAGSRFGGTPKQFRLLGGVPMLERAIAPFLALPDVCEVVAVVPAPVNAPPAVTWQALTDPRLRCTGGGATRTDSVAAGLSTLNPAVRIVLVHDGARPLVSTTTIAAVIAVVRSGLSAIAAIPLQDTLKESASDVEPPRVLRTVPRAGLWRAQTPQGFPRAVLEEAYSRPSEGATDDAMLVERLGAPVVLVPDSPLNLKVTTAEDLLLAEAIVERLG